MIRFITPVSFCSSMKLQHWLLFGSALLYSAFNTQAQSSGNFGSESSDLVKDKIVYFEDFQKDLENALIKYTRSHATSVESLADYTLYSLVGYAQDSSKVVIHYYDYSPEGIIDKNDELTFLTGDITITDSYIDGKFLSSKNVVEIDNTSYDFPLDYSPKDFLDLQKKIFFTSADIVSKTFWP